jgi:hypothetical protein
MQAAYRPSRQKHGPPAGVPACATAGTVDQETGMADIDAEPAFTRAMPR